MYLPTEDTLPKLLVANYRKYSDRKIAMRKKDWGIWQEYTWKDCYENVKCFSLGLVALGLKAGDKVAIIGDNDPEWYWGEFATIAAGGVAFGIFVDCTPLEVKYLLQNSESRFILAKDQEQIDKILNIKDELPLLVKAIYWDPKGLRNYNEPNITSLDNVIELGKAYEKEHPGLFEETIKKAKPDDPCIMCYTSGTTGTHQKGVVISNQSLVEGYGKTACQLAPFDSSWDYLSYISPAWSVEQALGITMGQMIGLVVNFPETPDTATQDIQEISPSFLMFPSQLWESMASTMLAKINDTNALFRFCYNLLLPIGYKVADMRLAGQSQSLFWRTIGTLAHFMLFRPIRDKFGLLKLKAALTGGAVTSPDTFRFFRALGVNLKQWYGFTEGGISFFHRDDDVRFESVGTPSPGMEVRLTDEGEFAFRSITNFSGYYKDPEATKKVFRDYKGWAYTGDAGYLREDGHGIYHDRLKDMVMLADGTRYAPQYIESRLRFSPFIKDVMVVGGEDKAYVSALIIVDFANVGKWAERNHIPYTTFADLSQKPEVYGLIRKDVDKLNKSLPAQSRVKKLVCVHKEFDPDDAELTRSRKLRRAFVEDRYRSLINAMYEDRPEFMVETEVKYQDGRTGITKTSVKIESLGENA